MLLKTLIIFGGSQIRCISSNIAAITRIHRPLYCRMYPTIIVLPNGSTITIRYHEPRQIIKLPLDLSTLSEAERKARLEARKPRKKMDALEEVDEKYDGRKYMKFLKK